MKNKVLTVVCILFGLMMIYSGMNKFFNLAPMPKLSDEMMRVMTAYMTVKWIFPLVGIIEIIGGILIAVPKTRALGAIVILPVMVGIILHHLVHDLPGVGVGVVLMIINVWVIIAEKDKYLPMINSK